MGSVLDDVKHWFCGSSPGETSVPRVTLQGDGGGYKFNTYMHKYIHTYIPTKQMIALDFFSVPH